MNQRICGAIDIGGSKIAVGLVADSGAVIVQERIPLDRGPTRENVLAAADRLRTIAGDTRLSAVGVTVPGLVDIDRGEWVHSPFTKIEGFAVRDELANRLGVPVAIDNDVNLSALAEHRAGVCTGESDFLWMTVSNGIGGALYLGGSLYRGKRGHAGEVGHVVVEPGGRGGDTGIPGTLESYACGRGIASMYTERSGDSSGDEPRVDARRVAELARDGNRTAIDTYAEAGRKIGRVCAGTINILNLPIVVIGGGVANAFDLLAPAITEILQVEVFGIANPAPRVLVSAFPTEAALIGAGLAAHDLTSKTGEIR